MTNVLVLYYSSYGHIEAMASAVADGVRREVETAVKGQMERVVNDLDLVKREDYDALRELVTIQGEEIMALRKEIDAMKRRKKTT